MNWYFWLAVLMSLLGPFCYHWISSRVKVSRFLDGLIITALVCLVTLHILPESLEHSGVTTFIGVVLGLTGPVFLSQLTKRKQCEIQKPFLVISIIGFIAHNMLDGAALIVHPNAHGSIHLLALAVTIHRLIESIAIWKTMSRSFGDKIAFLALAGLSMAMVFGFFFGEQIFIRMDAGILHFLQALACGMIFHVLLHPHHLKELISEAKSNNFLIKIQSAGAFCGLLLALIAYLFWPAHSHSTTHKNTAKNHAHTKSQ
jgi:zinc transporter ZupT